MNRGKMDWRKCKCGVCVEKKVFYDASQKYTLVSLNRMPRKLNCTRQQWWEMLARYRGPVFYKRKWLSWGSTIKTYYPLELVREEFGVGGEAENTEIKEELHEIHFDNV